MDYFTDQNPIIFFRVHLWGLWLCGQIQAMALGTQADACWPSVIKPSEVPYLLCCLWKLQPAEKTLQHGTRGNFAPSLWQLHRQVWSQKVVGGLHFGSYQYLSIEVVRQDGSDRQKYGDGVAEKNFVFRCRLKNTIFLSQISILTFHMVFSVLLRVLA